MIFYEFMEVCTFFTHVPLLFYSLKVALNPDKIGQGANQRRGSPDKTNISSIQGKKHRYKVFACKTDDNDDATNDSDNEDKLDKNTTSEDKSLVEVPPHKKRKTDKPTEKSTKKKTKKKGRAEKKQLKRSPLKKMLMTRKRLISQLKGQQKKKLSLRNPLKNIPRRRRLRKRNVRRL